MNATQETNIENQINEAVKDEKFIEKILTAEKLSDAQLLFKEKGINLTEDEMKEIGKYLSKLIQNNGNISDTELNNISGGKSSSIVYNVASGIGKVISAPFVALGYTVGAAPTGLIRGLVNGARETWIDYSNLD